MLKEDALAFYNKIADKRSRNKKRNAFYHKELEKNYSFYIPKGSRVLELGCGLGDLLNAVKPSYGVGVDFSEKMIGNAKERYEHLNFIHSDIEELNLNEKFDYIILSDLVNIVLDIQKVFEIVYSMCHDDTRIVISFYNPLWEYVIKTTEKLGLKQKQPVHNWVNEGDVENLLHLENFELVKSERKLAFPKYIPIFNVLVNTFWSNLPFISRFNLVNYMVARPLSRKEQEYSVSIVVPARNEKGNIENAILRTPAFGKWQEFIYVEGNSSDGTYDEILRVQEKYKDKKIVAFKQSGKGKGNAVREAFDKATGDVLMILDADLTTPPEEMDKFYNALKQNKGEFINGCRLVYPMEKQAMRFLNLLGNKFFSFFFTYLLGHRLKDTLCGTKVLRKEDYEKIKANRSYFGDFDPFGDFDLIFGAAKLNMRIVEVIIRYKDREYGSTQISRFRHGWLLIQMSFFAAFKFKFR